MPGRIRPGMKYSSNWVEIHGFTPNLTGHEILLKLGWNTAQIGLKFNGFTPNSTGQIRPGMKYWSNWVEIHCVPPWSNLVSSQWNQLASISMDLLPFWAVFHARSNLTGHEILVKMGVNSLRLHCIPPWSNWVSSQWIYSHFEQYFMPGRIRPGDRIWSPPSNWVGITGMIPNSISQAYKWNLSEFTPIFTNISCPVELGVNPLIGIIPNSTGHEILLKMGVNSLGWYPIQPGLKYCSNWV